MARSCRSAPRHRSASGESSSPATASAAFLAASNVSRSSLSMAEAARRDQNPSSAPPALPIVVWAWSRGDERREKKSDLGEGDNFIADERLTAPSSYQNPPLIRRWILLERYGSTARSMPRCMISYSVLGKGIGAVHTSDERWLYGWPTEVTRNCQTEQSMSNPECLVSKGMLLIFIPPNIKYRKASSGYREMLRSLHNSVIKMAT